MKGIKIIMIMTIKEQMKKDSIKTLENSQLILLKSARENRIIDSGKRVKRAHIFSYSSMKQQILVKDKSFFQF